MKLESNIRVLSNLNILVSIGLLVWWFLFPLLLPIGEAASDFQNLILHPNWVAVNLIGLIACLMLCIGLPSIYIARWKEYKSYGFAGMLLACAGLILFTAIQYYETFIWPAAAAINPKLLETNGALVSGDTVVMAAMLASGLILATGYTMFGIATIKTGKYNQWPVWLFMIGAVVFGNGIAFSVRTVGIILFCSGTIWLSNQIKLKKNEIN